MASNGRSQSRANKYTQATADGGCRIDIRIESLGDVNIYNCTAPQPQPPPTPCPPCPPTECPSRPIVPGQCVSLSLGAKPKQSQRSKLEKLLASNPVPSAIGASFIHISRRFLAGYQPANSFEHSAFGLLRSHQRSSRVVGARGPADSRHDRSHHHRPGGAHERRVPGTGRKPPHIGGIRYPGGSFTDRNDPYQYREHREYICKDSRYELVLRCNRVL